MTASIVLGIFFTFHLSLLPTPTPSNSEEMRNGYPIDIEDGRWKHANPGAVPHRKYQKRKKAKHYTANQLFSVDSNHLS